jgi:hypothetical protein
MSNTLKIAPEGLGNHLKRLTIFGVYWSTRMRDVLRAQTALKDLELDLSSPKKQLGQPTFQLESFSGYAPSYAHVNWRAINKLLKASRTTLATLELEISELPSVEDLRLERFAVLRSLELRCSFEDLEAVHRMLAIVKSCPTLRTLELDTKDDQFSNPGLEGVDLLRLLPSFLEEIHLVFIRFITTYLLALLADHRCLPRLRKLSLDHRVWEDGGLAARPRPLEELDTIADAGSRRGVEVDFLLACDESAYFESDGEGGEDA